MKTIALIRLLFTFSQRPCSRQLGLSPSPDRPTGPRPTSSSPSDSSGPYGPLAQAPTALQLAQIATYKTKLLECVCPRCVPSEREWFLDY